MPKSQFSKDIYFTTASGNGIVAQKSCRKRKWVSVPADLQEH